MGKNEIFRLSEQKVTRKQALRKSYESFDTGIIEKKLERLSTGPKRIFLYKTCTVTQQKI